MHNSLTLKGDELFKAIQKKPASEKERDAPQTQLDSVHASLDDYSNNHQGYKVKCGRRPLSTIAITNDAAQQASHKVSFEFCAKSSMPAKKDVVVFYLVRKAHLSTPSGTARSRA